jgi:DNA-binding XRE family transcriptional regulator
VAVLAHSGNWRLRGTAFANGTLFPLTRKERIMCAMVALSENLKKIRTSRGLSQRDLANRVGVSHPRISDIDEGRANPTLSTLEAIAGVLGITVSDLLAEPSRKTSEKSGKLPV